MAGRIPPPFPVGGRRSPPPPPPLPPARVEIEATPFDDVPTVVEHRCPGCAGPIDLVEQDAQPPDSYGEFLGKDGAVCRGNAQWYACREPAFIPAPVGHLGLPHQGIKAVFFDRRSRRR